MTDNPVAVSVIVATYASGEDLERVIASLDAQTMPAGEFEAIFVDDGSPDDTVERLQRSAATRPNMRVIALEHSGWPSRPRNTGVDTARGEYVLFMDHDDSLYPDGLRRAYEFALEHDSDVVNLKESNSSDVWWAMDSFGGGNVANIHDEGGVGGLQELTPHKLYRRSLLLEHHIRFPEARRFLWEDWYVNVPAYRHGAVVSVLADTPVYLWQVGENNTTRTFDCAREDYWDRLEDLFEHITTTLEGERFAQDRLELLVYNVRLRVIQRVARLLNRRQPPTADSAQMAFARARILLEQYGTPEVLARLSNKHLALAHLFAEGTTAHVLAFEVAERSVQASADLRDYRWDDSSLMLETTTTWRSTQPSLARFAECDGRWHLDVGPELSAMIPPELLDLSRELEHVRSDLALRDRFGHVTWALPFHTEPAEVQVGEKGRARVVQRGRGAVDLATTAGGHPLPDAVWDLRLRTNLYGIDRTPAVGCRAGRLAATVGSRAAIVYRNKWRNFTLDLAQELRTLAVDAAPRVGPIGPIGNFSARLTALHAGGTGRIPSMLVAVPLHDELLAHERYVAEHPFTAEVVVDDDGARLQGRGDLAPGDYRLYARQRSGLNRTGYGLTVNPVGDAQLITIPD